MAAVLSKRVEVQRFDGSHLSGLLDEKEVALNYRATCAHSDVIAVHRQTRNTSKCTLRA